MKTLDLLKANFVNRFIRGDGDDTVDGSTTWKDGKSVQLGNSGDHRSYHTGTDTFHDNNTGDEYHRQNAHGKSVFHQAEDSAGVRKTVMAIIGGASPYFKAYFAGSEKFKTTSVGTETNGDHNTAGHLKESNQRVFSPNNRNISDSVTSSSTTIYASVKGVKAAYDRGTAALNAANAKWTYVQASLSAYGATKLSSAVNSTSEALAATPKAVKSAYDLAASKMTQGTADGRYLSKTAKATLTDNDGHGNANLVGNHKDGVPVSDGSSYRLEMSTDTDTATAMFEMGNSVRAGVAKTLTAIWTATTSSFDVKINLLEKGQRVFSPNNRNISSAVNSASATVYAAAAAVKTAYDKGVEGLNKANQAYSLAAGKWTYVVASKSVYGATKLSSVVNSTSEALAATPKAVKTAYDLAASKITKAQGDSYYLAKTATAANSSKLNNIAASGYSRAFSGGVSTGGGNWTTAQLVSWLTSQGAFNQPHWVARCSWSYASNRNITDTGVGTIHLSGCTLEVIGNANNFTLRILCASTSSGGGDVNTEYVYCYNGTSYSPTWRRVYSTHDKPTKSDVGLASVVNAGQTSAVNNTSTTTYATAKAVKTAYDKAVEALNVANNKPGVGDRVDEATWADTVDVNTSASTSFYNVTWHSGDTLYSTSSGAGFTYRPSDGFSKIKHGYIAGTYIYHQTDGKMVAHNTGKRSAGMYGVYDSNKIGHIWSMGTAYKIDDNGATFGNLYGMAYKHTDNGTGGTMAGGHQAVWCSNGIAKAAMGEDGLWGAGVYDGPGTSRSRVFSPNNRNISSATNSTSTTLYASVNGVKAAYDLAASKMTQATADGLYLGKTAKAASATLSDKTVVHENETSTGTWPVMWNDNSHQLYDSGDRLTFQPSSGNLIAAGNVAGASDIRVKDEIKVIGDALAKVGKLRGVTYRRTDLSKDQEEDIYQTGLIAGEVSKVLPEAVTVGEYAGYSDFQSVSYGNMMGLAVEAIKELTARDEAKDETISNLESKVTTLSEELASLKEMVRELAAK